MFDLFSYTQERKNEIKLISQYESDMKKFLPFYNGSNCDLLKELASLPIEIKGFGHVKEQSIQEASQKRQKIIDSLEVSPVPHLHAAE